MRATIQKPTYLYHYVSIHVELFLVHGAKMMQ